MTRDRTFLTEITGDAGLRHAQGIASILRTALAEHDKVVVSTAGITSADITTIQLLLAARKGALAAGKSFALAAPPEGVLRDLLVEAGFIDAGGAPLADGDFWTPSSKPTKGKAA